MKTKTKLKRENRKRLKTKTTKLKTKMKTKIPKQQNFSLNESASIQCTMRHLRVLQPYGVESVTNGGRYLGRSSTHLRQQV